VIDKTGRTDLTWSRAEFEWDEENDQYICPDGHALRQFRRNYADPSRGKNITGTRKYRALRATCQACPSKDLWRAFARDRRKAKACKVSRNKRKKVEMLFAHLKRILNLTRLRLRGPSGARDEFTLAAIAQNLRKSVHEALYVSHLALKDPGSAGNNLRNAAVICASRNLRRGITYDP
jgi:hypothetical protein